MSKHSQIKLNTVIHILALDEGDIALLKTYVSIYLLVLFFIEKLSNQHLMKFAGSGTIYEKH